MERIGKLSFVSFSLLFAMLIPVTLFANNDVTVQSKVDRPEIRENEEVTVRVSVISSEAVEVQEPRMPDLEGFDFVDSWTNQSQSSQLVQGRHGMEFSTTRRLDFNYKFAPKTTGKLKLGSFEVVVDGRSFRTKPITVHVHDASESSDSQEEEDDYGFDDEDVFSQLLRRGRQFERGYRSAPADPQHAFFVQLELDKTEAYEGEQILANWYIYTRGIIESIDRVKFPDLKGFWKEDIEITPTLSFSNEIVNGVPYKKALLASYALFPISAGTSVIDDYKVKSIVRLPTSGFGSFGFGRPYEYTRSSEVVKINVKPLPRENQPSDFSGAVGQFEIDGKIDGDRFTVNQPFTMRVRFDGQGNAKLIDLPSLELPSTLELYSTRQESQFYKTGRSFKEFEILIIPRQAGEVTIPSLSVSIFDPELGSYVRKSTQPVTLNIEEGQGSESLPAVRLADRDKSEDRTEVGPQLPGPVISSKLREGRLLAPPLPVAGFAILGALCLLAFKARREFEWGANKKNVKAEVRDRFKKVYASIAKGNWRQASVEVTNTVYYVFGEVVGAGGANMEMDKLINLAPSSLRRSLEPDLSQLVERFQALSFAPEAVLGELKKEKSIRESAKQMESLLMRAAELVEQKDQN